MLQRSRHQTVHAERSGELEFGQRLLLLQFHRTLKHGGRVLARLPAVIAWPLGKGLMRPSVGVNRREDTSREAGPCSEVGKNADAEQPLEALGGIQHPRRILQGLTALPGPTAARIDGVEDM